MKRVAAVALSSLALCFPPAIYAHAVSLEEAHGMQAAPNCQNFQLRMGANNSQGAAGHIAIIYRFHNQSNQSCSLFGYPGVLLLGRHFTTLPTTVHRTPGNLVGPIRPHLVRLNPGANAYFALGYSDVPAGKPCRVAYYLMVFPPNDFLPIITYSSPGGIIACSGSINVSPVTHRPRFQ